jgi:hypothetical protein
LMVLEKRMADHWSETSVHWNAGYAILVLMFIELVMNMKAVP